MAATMHGSHGVTVAHVCAQSEEREDVDSLKHRYNSLVLMMKNIFTDAL